MQRLARAPQPRTHNGGEPQGDGGGCDQKRAGSERDTFDYERLLNSHAQR